VAWLRIFLERDLMSKHQITWRCDAGNLTDSIVLEAEVSKVRCQGCDKFLKVNVKDITLDGPPGHRLLRIAETGRTE
jgi:hypothetical protein